MSKKGGYVIVDLKGQNITLGTPFTLDGVTARLDRAKNKACLLSGFAIGNDEKRDVFVDLQKTEDGYVALFGQYTITIKNDEVTITDGGVLLENIVDSQGNKRFTEGDGTVATITNYTPVYNKWSLSGSHLLIVVSGTFADTAEAAADTILFTLNDLPDYIKNKVVPIAGNRVDAKIVKAYASNGTSQDLTIMCRKESDVYVQLYASITFTAERTFRYQLDLLIDTD